ncbi:hypothetical protein [Bathymodiolus platifrons methanotrophic gill symbiont]|uniref:hypothetical protein n=1 Tax=Bathymodiolus platifrons methanotrophic gill symbiont TaxID=113268 RepID=UPI001C8DA4DD|nr:hypothetical protein [Bathymodiolus platifrons methanotrophic gill symbiont]
MLYFKRWTIEKAFNNSKSNLKETKAWSSDNNSLKKPDAADSNELQLITHGRRAF